jgi:hypothetical protein
MSPVGFATGPHPNSLLEPLVLIEARGKEIASHLYIITSGGLKTDSEGKTLTICRHDVIILDVCLPSTPFMAKALASHTWPTVLHRTCSLYIVAFAVPI